MATCKHCKRRRGRRRCPALGRICSICCAKHKVVKIDCPDDCPHLGAAVQRVDPFRRVSDKLMSFSMEIDWGADEVEEFIAPDRRIREWEHECFVSYLLYGIEDEQGERLVDVYARERGASLGPKEAEVLAALRQARFSLLEVQEVRLDEGIDFIDQITGEAISVQERSATHSLKRLDLVLAWTIPIGGHHELTSLCGVPRVHREAVADVIEDVLADEREYDPEVPDEVALRRAAALAQCVLREEVEQWQPPKMVTMDHEEIVFCTATFDVHDVEAVEQRLREHPDLDAEDERFVWLDRAGRSQLGGGPLVLGTFQLKPPKRRLTLEVQSKERLAKGKAFVAGLLGELVQHRLDGIKDLEVAMAEHAARPPRPSTIPEEVQAEALSAFMSDRLMQWIDESLPVLGGKTPRQTVETEAGREQVVALLKDQESITLRMPGGDRVDYAAVYAALGLPSEP